MFMFFSFDILSHHHVATKLRQSVNQKVSHRLGGFANHVGLAKPSSDHRSTLLPVFARCHTTTL